MSFKINSQSFGPEEPKIIPLTLVVDERGCIGVAEAGAHIPFNPERFYFITAIPEGAERGGHAHKQLWQFLVAIRGSVTIELTDGRRSYSFHLTNFDRGLLVPPGWWRDMRNFRSDALLAVLASRPYEEEDYIRDLSEFLAWSASNAEVNSVPYLSLQRQVSVGQEGQGFGAAIRRASQEVLQSGYYIGGPDVAAFEEAFAEFSQTEKAIGVGNGLEALELALLAEGIGPGDEVIIPAHTFVATALAVVNVGARPTLVDVEADTGLIDCTRIEGAIGPATRAIIPVHLYGHPVDMDPILRLAEGRSLYVLEDAAQAHGATYHGRPCGSLGHAAAFSFYPTKNLGAMGDAGAVTTSDLVRAATVRKLANYGSATRYVHELVGRNSRLDPVQAAILSCKLLRLPAWNERRRVLAHLYLEGLAGIDGLVLPAIRSWAMPVWHVFAVRVKNGRREELARFLDQHQIGTNIHYPIPVHEQPCFATQDWIKGSFPNAEMLSREVLSLPLDPFHTDEEIRLVVRTVVGFFLRS